jgi:glyoxylate utilization-related uncharacterized protein
MTRHLLAASLAAVVATSAVVDAQTLAPLQQFDGNITVAAPNGATQPARLSVQSWRISGSRSRQSPTLQIPLTGFYLARLVSGEVQATIDGRTSKKATGEYWVVPTGTTMQVQAIGEVAILETTVVTKQ